MRVRSTTSGACSTHKAAPTRRSEHFRKAVHADAGNVQAHRNVAWHLAIRANLTPDEQREAVTAGERAAALTSQNDPQVLEALGAAYASAGRFDRAAATVQRALSLTRDAALVATLRAQLALYQQTGRIVCREHALGYESLATPPHPPSLASVAASWRDPP